MKIIVWAFLTALVTAFLVVVLVTFAYAHGDAGWINELGLGCCGPSDCVQEPDGRWRRLATGFYNVVTKEWVPEHMIRAPSVDDHYWACRSSGVLRNTSGENGAVGICLFPPAVGW